ncbi:MAG TPA: hypothetical protein VMH22_08470 [bacterium]|nr:hypothetical protein [bacterium]
MSRTSMTALCLVLGFLVVTGIGCMKCGENVSRKVTEKALEAAVNKTTGGKATIDVGSDVDISGLPAALRYPGAKPTARYSMTSEHGTGTVYTLETTDPSATVVTFYKAAFAGWKQSMISEGEQGTTLVYGNDATKEWTSMTVSKGDGGKTTIVLTYTKGQ